MVGHPGIWLRQCLSDAWERPGVALAQEISKLALRKVNRTIAFGLPRRLRLYGYRKVSMHAVMKFHTDRCAG
jgi:hypothetical protein